MQDYVILLLTILGFFIAYYFGPNLRHVQGLRLPPGPRPLPIVGNLFHLPKDMPWVTYRDWALKYGEMPSLPGEQHQCRTD